MIRPGLRFRLGGRLTPVGRPPLHLGSPRASGARGPSARVRAARIAVLALVAVAGAGCFGGGTPLPAAVPGAEIAPDARGLARLSDDLAEPDADRLALTVAALARAGVSPLADARVPGTGGQFIVGRDRQTLAGWIPGRIPLHRDSLVVVSAPHDGMHDLALIEAARLLVASGAYTQVPARSVLIVLGDDVDAALRLWSRSTIVGALGVGRPPMPESTAGGTIRPRSAATSETALLDMAVATYDRLRGAVTPPSPYVRVERD